MSIFDHFRAIFLSHVSRDSFLVSHDSPLRAERLGCQNESILMFGCQNESILTDDCQVLACGWHLTAKCFFPASSILTYGRQTTANVRQCRAGWARPPRRQAREPGTWKLAVKNWLPYVKNWQPYVKSQKVTDYCQKTTAILTVTMTSVSFCPTGDTFSDVQDR